MRHKTITLCPTTYELSKKMPNFSQWVRDQVLKHGRTNNMHKESRIMFHRECGSDVQAEWKQFMDGSFAWFGYCEACHSDVVWRPRQWVTTAHFTSITIGLPGNQHLTGYCHLSSMKVLKDLGGNASDAIRYSSQLHFVHATHVIRSVVIAGSVHHELWILVTLQLVACLQMPILQANSMWALPGGRVMRVGYCQCENIQWIWANDQLPTAPCIDCGCQITWSDD